MNKKLKLTISLILGLFCMAVTVSPGPLILTSALYPFFLIWFAKNIKTKRAILILIPGMYIAQFIGGYRFTSMLPIGFQFVISAFGMITLLIPLLIYLFFSKRFNGLKLTFIYPAVYLLKEFIDTLGEGMGIWGSMSISIRNELFIMQSTSIFGVLSFTFLLAWIGPLLNWFIEKKWDLKVIKKPLLIICGVLVFIWSFGAISLANKKADTVRIAGIANESNIFGMYAAEDREAFISLLSNYNKIDDLISKTIKASEAGAKIILWSEDALFVDSEREDYIFNKLKDIAVEYNVYISPSYLKLKDDLLANKQTANMTFMFTSQGELAYSYKKAHPVRGVETPIVETGDGVIPFIDTPYGRIGSVICTDIEFPRMLTQLSKNNIQLLLNPSYDWDSIGWLHPQQAAIQAAQHRVSLFRVTADGTAAAIDNRGRFRSFSNTFETEERVFYADVPVDKDFSFYDTIGWIFPYVIFAILFVIIIHYLVAILPKEIKNLKNK